MRVFENVKYGRLPEQILDCYFPRGEDFATVVYFHGGGLETGYKTDGGVADYARALTENGVGFVSAEYRKYPAASFPDFLVDGAAAVGWVKRNAPLYGGNGKIFVCGHSAGAYISLMLCFDGRYLEKEGMTSADVSGWLIDSAQTTTHFNVLKERGLDTRLQRVDEAAPVYFVNEKSTFSKILLIFYENDMPVRPEQNAMFYKAVKNFNPAAKIELRLLPGGHCESAAKKNGRYPFEDILSDFVKESAG
ncbi:MAG: alpha/beta hydrolase [Clostridia bacterium]|nr:alpha/beta hydrolase [Clostridia bacterium]